jgi:uncharacterized small protein (DUF1192 family)
MQDKIILDVLREIWRDGQHRPKDRPKEESMTISKQYAEELGRQVDELEAENALLRKEISRLRAEVAASAVMKKRRNALRALGND